MRLLYPIPSPARLVPVVCFCDSFLPMRIADFQQHIHDRYFATDSARGAAGTFLWFSEEVGELAHALGKHERGDRTPADRDNLEEEFADVMAWLATLANITGIDLTQAVTRKYMQDGGPKGTK
jgi:NTP pyrophosphatase (non-canonical NTP hydrolase)